MKAPQLLGSDSTYSLRRNADFSLMWNGFRMADKLGENAFLRHDFGPTSDSAALGPGDRCSAGHPIFLSRPADIKSILQF